MATLMGQMVVRGMLGMAGSVTDISERKRAEREVVESRDQLRLVTDNLPALIVYLDTDLRYRFANKTTAEWHARPVEEIIGKSAPELLGQEYEKLRPRIDRVFAGEQLTYIDSVTYPDGVTRTVRGNYVPHFGEAGSVEGCFSLVEDITERMEAEEAHRERQAHLQAIADNSPAATFLKDTDSRYIFASRVWHDMYNPTGADIAGKTAHDFLPPEIADAVAAADAKVLETGAPTVEELILPTAQGESQNILFTKFPVFDDSGNIIALGGFNIDITERVEAELVLRDHQERLRLLLETTPAIPWEADAKSWIFTYVGPQAAELLGYPHERWLEKDFWVEHIHPEDRAWAVEYCLTASNQNDNFEFEYRMIAANGRTVWLQDIVNVVKEDGTPVVLRGFMIDITARKRAEEALHDVSIRLISSQEEERSRIARELHDDFGQRLALISVKLEQLQDGWPSTRDSFVSDTTPLVQAVKELSSDIHRMSHQLHPSILQHLGLLTAIESFCKEISSQHDIRINIVHHGVPHTLSSEVKLCLYRIVQEALRNVVKHANAERVQVEITGAEGELSLQISDNGTGFDPQSAQAQKGLGLLSMRERLRLVNGRVSFRQAEPTGTRIDVRVPF